jgi:hypothetical protein
MHASLRVAKSATENMLQSAVEQPSCKLAAALQSFSENSTRSQMTIYTSYEAF